MFKKFFVGIFIVLFMFCGVVSAGVNDGLVLNYSFNGNANDISGNENDGVVNGPILTTDRFEAVDSAYEWDESYDYIVKENMNWNADILTISVWFYLETGVDRTQCIVSGIKHPDFFYFGYNAAGTFTFRVQTGVGTNGIVWSTFNSYTVLNKWTNLTVIWNGNELSNSARIFVNGIESSINYVYCSALTPLIINKLHLGLRFGNESREGQQFAGKIDDVRVYNRMLSNEEIQQLYTGIFVPTLEDRIVELELVTDSLVIENDNLNLRVDNLETVINDLQFTFGNHTHIYKTGPSNEHSQIDVETSIPQ